MFFMRDISFKDLKNIVEFMYRGKVNVAQSELGSFLKTAETLQVRGLTGDEEPAQPEVSHVLNNYHLKIWKYMSCNCKYIIHDKYYWSFNMKVILIKYNHCSSSSIT